MPAVKPNYKVNQIMARIIRKRKREAAKKGMKTQKRKMEQLKKELRKEKIFKFLVEYPLDEKVPTQRQVSEATKIPLNQVNAIMREPDFWKEVCEARRKRIAEAAVKIDSALIRTAQKGKVDAIRLFYERHENWAKRIQLTEEVKKDIDIKLYRMEPEEIIQYITSGELPSSPQMLPGEVIEGEIKETEKEEAEEK